MGAQGWRQRRRKRIRKHPVRQSWISLGRGKSVIKVFVRKSWIILNRNRGKSDFLNPQSRFCWVPSSLQWTIFHNVLWFPFLPSRILHQDFLCFLLQALVEPALLEGVPIPPVITTMVRRFFNEVLHLHSQIRESTIIKFWPWTLSRRHSIFCQ